MTPRRYNISVKLWSINRWLRYTGLRVFVSEVGGREASDDSWTTIGVAWYGLPGSASWRKIEGT